MEGQEGGREEGGKGVENREGEAKGERERGREGNGRRWERWSVRERWGEEGILTEKCGWGRQSKGLGSLHVAI